MATDLGYHPPCWKAKEATDGPLSLYLAEQVTDLAKVLLTIKRIFASIGSLLKSGGRCLYRREISADVSCQKFRSCGYSSRPQADGYIVTFTTASITKGATNG